MTYVASIKQKRLWSYVCIFVLGVISYMPLHAIWNATVGCNTQYDLLSSKAVCDSEKEELTEWDYDPLRQRLLQRIEHYTSSGTVPHIALYFRDLQSGSRFGVRENELFEPASLLKLPIMMVLLHQAENNPAFMSERLTYEKEYSYGFVTEESDESIQLHSSYTIRELIEKMIKNSDNNATNLLLDKINAMGLRENSNTFSDLGTMQLLMSGELDNTRLISLVNIFVSLYSANYLTQSSSQFALELLTQTSFDNGIAGGVPAGIRVAHKYGIRIGTPEESELHDCGIVYHPSSPYVLCVLTAGADFDASSAAIRDISTIVYKGVDSLKP